MGVKNWNKLNARRFELIEKKVKRVLHAGERAELERLQELADEIVASLLSPVITALEVYRDKLKQKGIWEGK